MILVAKLETMRPLGRRNNISMKVTSGPGVDLSGSE
jgi:hypothetical protein